MGDIQRPGVRPWGCSLAAIGQSYSGYQKRAEPDPDFEPSQPAFYYGRVIEIPTPRWTAYDAKFFGLKADPKVTMKLQERAYTSPIWYTPKR